MESMQRMVGVAVIGLVWLSASPSLAESAKCVKTPFQQTISVADNLPPDTYVNLSAAYHLPPEGYEIEQLSLRATTTAPLFTFVAVLVAGISIQLQGQQVDHPMDGWIGQAPYTADGVPATKSQAFRVYADGDTDIVGTVTVVARQAQGPSTPIVVEWIVSGRLVTPGCWSTPQ